MIIGLGSDLIDIRRVEKSIDRFGDRFLLRIFTETERIKSDRRNQRAASYAKRFAAKEACAKAAGEGLRLRFAELGFAPGQDGPGFDGGTECEEITGPAPRSGRWGFAYCSPTPGYTFAFARCLH